MALVCRALGKQQAVCPADDSGENSGQSLIPIGTRPLISQEPRSSGARSDIGQEPLTSLSNRGLPLRDANVGSIRSQPGEHVRDLEQRLEPVSVTKGISQSAKPSLPGSSLVEGILQICLDRWECASVRPSLVTVPQIS